MEIKSRFDFIEPGDATALVCIDEPELQHTVVEQLDSLSYKIHTGLFAEDISLKLKAQKYDVLVIYENFNHADLETNPVVAEVGAMPLNERREQLVVLIGANFATNNLMQAFEYSVDLVCSISDILSLSILLRRAKERRDSFYRNFKECLVMASNF
jgi:hypothetical protein